MKDSTYLKQMLVLTQRLCDACNTDGYGSDAYNEVLKEISVSAARFNRSWLVSSRVMSFVVIAAILFVLYLVYCIVSEGFGL